MPIVTIVGDAHAHIYPCHDAARALTALRRNLDRHVANAGIPAAAILRMAFLLSTATHDAFEKLGAEHGLANAGLATELARDGLTLDILFPDVEKLRLIAARQMATAERLEVLGLFIRAPLPDGRSAADTIRMVLQSGGVPVLPWSPGKWLFARRRVVEELMDIFGPQQILLGDSALRADIWGRPAPLRDGQARGFAVLPGSDPLPLVGEEERLGLYGFAITGQLGPAPTNADIKRLLLNSRPRPIGRRLGAAAMLARLARLRFISSPNFRHENPKTS